MTDLYPEFFNDVFGPITQPGSSSHMAGPCRAGFLANSLLGEQVSEIVIELDPEGSFHEGFGQMNEDVGMLNGAHGNLPVAKDFFDIKKILKDEGIPYRFEYTHLKESSHPNAMRFTLTGISGRRIRLTANSIGGGMVEIVDICGYSFSGKGDTAVLFIEQNGKCEEDHTKIKEALKEFGVLFSGTDVKDKTLHWFKLEKEISSEDAQTLLQALGIEAKTLGSLRPILPVPTTEDKLPQKFKSMIELRELAEKEGKTLFDVAVDYEVAASGWSREEVLAHMREEVEPFMKRRITALYEDESLLIYNPFRKIYYREWEEKADGKLVSGVTERAIHYMHSAQAMMKGVLDVPGPMSNGAGYMYSVLQAVREAYDLTDEDVLRGLFIAAGVGAIAYTRTAPTGEIIGCAGECGVCAAMTAAAVAEMLRATPIQVENAASMTLQAAIGWPCDPVPGGQGTPCTSRTLFIVTMPQVYARWAMMGTELIIPFHEVLDAADKVGRGLPSGLLCTARGGLCDTPSGKKCMECFNKALTK